MKFWPRGFDTFAVAIVRWQNFLSAAVVLCCITHALASESSEPKSFSARTVQHDLVLAEARMALADADRGLGSSAQRRLSNARFQLAQLSSQEAKDLLVKLDRSLVHLEKNRRSQEASSVTLEYRSSLNDVFTTRDDKSAHLQNSLKVQIDRIRTLIDHGQLELALNLARRLVSDFPNDPSVESLFNDVLTRTHDQRRLTVRERLSEATQELNARIERDLLPSNFDGLPRFPADWEVRTSTRAHRLNAESSIPIWEQQLRARLAERLTISYDQQIPSDIFKDLSTRGHINLVVDPAVAALDKPISFKASNITLSAALNWACQLSDITWHLSNEAVYIGGNAEDTLVINQYDISELMFQGKDQTGHAFGLSSGGSGGGQGPATSLLAGAGNADPSTPALTTDAIIEMVKKTVSPESWNKTGFGINAHGTTLLVTASPNIHALIRQFIRGRSGLQTVMVNIETRWLTIDDGYLEEIGVEWNTNSSNLVTNGTNAGIVHKNDTHSITGNSANILPASMSNFATAGTINAGLRLSSAILKSVQLNAVMHAVESNQRGTVLGAPTLATTNGVRSSCFFGSQQAYISDYDIMSTTYSPKISVLNVGVTLDLKPYVSADAKYVTMELKPQIADSTMTQETIIAVTNRYSQTSGGGVTVIGNLPISTSYTLDLPTLRLKAAATTVRIPDRGTLLIGGFGTGLDQQSSTKIPFLGHIPFLGRLFGARGRYSDRRQVYLLTTVHVINYQELEASL